MRGVRDAVQIRDLTYRQVDGTDLHLDLYLPEGESSGPAVVYVHGGAWLMGNRQESAERFHALAAAGLAVASIEYRTINRGSYPSQRDDILAAGVWLHRRWHRADGSLGRGASGRAVGAGGS
jgi:acetyl esterase/lipase